MTETRSKQIEVFTIGYFPFTMGGSVYRPIKTTVTGLGPYDLGGGYSGYLVIAPNGKCFVAESSTGAFVGDTLEQVRADITAAADNPELMQNQIKEAQKQVQSAEVWEESRFWKALKAS